MWNCYRRSQQSCIGPFVVSPIGFRWCDYRIRQSQQLYVPLQASSPFLQCDIAIAPESDISITKHSYCILPIPIYISASPQNPVLPLILVYRKIFHFHNISIISRNPSHHKPFSLYCIAVIHRSMTIDLRRRNMLIAQQLSDPLAHPRAHISSLYIISYRNCYLFKGHRSSAPDMWSPIAISALLYC